MRAVVVVVALALLVAGCSGDDDAAPATTVAFTDDSVTSTTTAVTDTTASPSTLPETTTTTTDATTDATTTPTAESSDPTVPRTLPADLTDEEFTALRDDVVAAALAAEEAFDLAKRNPTDEEVLRELSDVMTAERRQWIADNFIVPYVINGLEERPNPDLPFVVEPRPATFTVDPVAGTASLEICTLSSNLLVEPGGNADGSDKVHDDQFASVLVRREMAFVDGRWLDDGGVDVSIEEGATECAE